MWHDSSMVSSPCVTWLIETWLITWHVSTYHIVMWHNESYFTRSVSYKSYMATRLFMWHDSLRVWLIYWHDFIPYHYMASFYNWHHGIGAVRDVTPSCMRWDPFMDVTWLVHVRDWLIHVRDVTWLDSFVYVVWIIHVCDVTRSCTREREWERVGETERERMREREREREIPLNEVAWGHRRQGSSQT